jgi:TrmH family RNA methyltransferase
MANFGFSHLSVVAPYEAHWREAQSAIGASELLQNAKGAERLEDAIADCTLVIGTGTLAYRKAEQPVVLLPELGGAVTNELSRGGRIALVFGSEKHGLTREDLSYCHLLAVIPTGPQQPSMNLGQAVAVFLYELAGRNEIQPELPVENAVEASPFPVASGKLDRLAVVIEEAMLAAGYSPKGMQAANRHDLRLLLRRLKFNNADARRALGLFRRALHRMRR